MLNRIVTAFVLSGLLVSAPTSAAPDGSLRKMLDTNITLIEYITLQTRLKSVERLVTGEVTKWGDYSGTVKLDVVFNYDDSELMFALAPVDKHYFSTVSEAKTYCRDLIRAERTSVFLLLSWYARPNGWSSGSLKTDDFFGRLSQSSKIRLLIVDSRIKEELPEEDFFLECIASLDDEGKIKNFSYNL